MLIADLRQYPRYVLIWLVVSNLAISTLCPPRSFRIREPGRPCRRCRFEPYSFGSYTYAGSRGRMARVRDTQLVFWMCAPRTATTNAALPR